MDINKIKQANRLLQKIEYIQTRLDKLKSPKKRTISVIEITPEKENEIAYFFEDDKDVQEFLKKKEQELEDRIEDLKKQIEAL